MKQIILFCLLMLSGFLGGGGVALSDSQCVNYSKCNDAGNSNHSGKQCCDNGVPIASCEASTNSTCLEDCVIEGGSTKDCSNECTSTSCVAY